MGYIIENTSEQDFAMVLGLRLQNPVHLEFAHDENSKPRYVVVKQTNFKNWERTFILRECAWAESELMSATMSLPKDEFGQRGVTDDKDCFINYVFKI